VTRIDHAGRGDARWRSPAALDEHDPIACPQRRRHEQVCWFVEIEQRE
jgi:hypothetical protein